MAADVFVSCSCSALSPGGPPLSAAFAGGRHTVLIKPLLPVWQCRMVLASHVVSYEGIEEPAHRAHLLVAAVRAFVAFAPPTGVGSSYSLLSAFGPGPGRNCHTMLVFIFACAIWSSMLVYTGMGMFFFLISNSSHKLKEQCSCSILPNIWLFPPSVVPARGRPISSETSGLWQGGLFLATHSCNMDGAFHISVGNKGNGSRSFSINTSHDLPRSWQRQKEGERGGEIDRVILTRLSKGCFFIMWQWTPATRWAGPYLQYSYTQLAYRRRIRQQFSLTQMYTFT